MARDVVGTFESVCTHLRRRNILASVQEISTGNFYRISALLSKLRVDFGQPGYNPNLRFAEVEYVDKVSEGTQGFINWIVPEGWTGQTGQPAIPANPGQRLPLYRVITTQHWNPAGPNWQPDWVNGQRQ